MIRGNTLSFVGPQEFIPQYLTIISPLYINCVATGVGIEIRTSTDRTAWTYTGLVWPSGASWTDQYTGTSNGYVQVTFNSRIRTDTHPALYGRRTATTTQVPSMYVQQWALSIINRRKH